MNKKGFTLLELILIICVLSIAFILAIPKVLKIIEKSKYDTFVTGVMNTLDAVDLYIAQNKFMSIPEQGLYIEDIDSSVLKNNNYDSGIIVRRKEQIEVINLKMGDYCAKGNKQNLITTDKGCGALDETKPTKINIFVKNETSEYLYLVIGGYDEDSKIIKYELSIDNGKYFTNNDEKYNVFKIKKDNKNHTYKAKITNEANLSLESDFKKFDSESETTICELEKFNSNINVICNLEKAIFEENTQKQSMLFTGNKSIKLKNSVSDIDINILGIDELLKENTPVLEEYMIPVTISNDKWIIADKNTIYWDYENKIWANAVITRKNQDINDPNSKSREYYLSKEAIGEEINENDIIGYYVWIPKFSYEVWNSSGIDIKKENKGVTNINITFDNSNIHKSFLYNENVQGFWVSKYEAGITNDTCTTNSCNIDNIDMLFKENISPLKNISISNAYKSIVNLNKELKISNPHLMTNLEWGAITYLSHSKYGIGTNIINETTTGNVTGVYNMGINSEFVMGNFNNDFGFDESDNSGFTELPEKYVDIYKSSSIKGRILGDATSETENWYDSSHKFINGNYPFIIRGTNSIFDFSNSSGSANENITFRMTFGN